MFIYSLKHIFGKKFYYEIISFSPGYACFFFKEHNS